MPLHTFWHTAQEYVSWRYSFPCKPNAQLKQNTVSYNEDFATFSKGVKEIRIRHWRINTPRTKEPKGWKCLPILKTISLHQGEHFFWDYAFWDSTFPHWDSNISWIFLVLLEARLLGGDVAPFLDDWLLDLPRVALRPGAHLKEKNVKV